MSKEKIAPTPSRSLRWDLTGVCLFGMAALVWLALLTHDSADDVSRIFGGEATVDLRAWDPRAVSEPTLVLPDISGDRTSSKQLGQTASYASHWFTPAAFPPNAVIQNGAGYLGALVSQVLFQATGIGAYLVACLFTLAGVVCFRQVPWASPLGRSIGWTLVLTAVCALPDRLGLSLGLPIPIGGGGHLGALANTWLNHHLAFTGGLICILATLCVGLLLSTEYALVRYLGLATTHGVSFAKAFRLPKVPHSKSIESLTGGLGKNSDLAPAVALKANSPRGTAPNTAAVAGSVASAPIPSFSDLGKQPFGKPLPVNPDGTAIDANDELAEGEDSEQGPSIRIGRRATAAFSTQDLTGGSKAIGRTDLASLKPGRSKGSKLSGAELDPEDQSEFDANDDQSARAEDLFHESDEVDSVESSSAALQSDWEFDDGATIEEETTEGKDSERVKSPTEDESKSKDDGPKVKNSKTRKKLEEEEERNSLYSSLNDTQLPAGSEEYVLPSVELLTLGDDFSYDEQTEEVKRKARVLEQTFANFGFNIRVVEIETGPVIAQYEIELEAGLRLSKITGLADDLAIALRVPSVRIVAPIPGKNTVGIEVPNEKRQVVRMREVIEEGAAQVRKMKIPLFLGKDVSGKPLSVDLASLPHLLIAGRTGTGKSVCLNSIICSILMARRPDEVRMLMIDPKMVELSGYGRLPHLMHPVVTDMRKAEAILAWAVDKMEERYALLARAGVRHISSYNQLGRDELRDRLQPEDDEEAEMIPDHLPFIVIVADEMADLMMTAGKEVEAHIIRLAQKSRAVGIHLILATQKPTVDVITGLIKSNLPARISFQVASRTDSRVVLDENGADKLLGNGDMLFLWPGTSTLLRGQGTYLSDDEINAVVDHCSTGEQNFVQELVQLKVKEEKEGEGKAAGSFKRRDDLYESAVDIVVREGRGSCSLLQRALGIGYGRAARLIDFMAEDGIVGEYAGSQAREVVITIDQWEQMRAGAEEPATNSKSRSNKIRRENNWDEPPIIRQNKSTSGKTKPAVLDEINGGDFEDDDAQDPDDDFASSDD